MWKTQEQFEDHAAEIEVKLTKTNKKWNKKEEVNLLQKKSCVLINAIVSIII